MQLRPPRQHRPLPRVRPPHPRQQPRHTRQYGPARCAKIAPRAQPPPPPKIKNKTPFPARKPSFPPARCAPRARRAQTRPSYGGPTCARTTPSPCPTHPSAFILHQRFPKIPQNRELIKIARKIPPSLPPPRMPAQNEPTAKKSAPHGATPRNNLARRRKTNPPRPRTPHPRRPHAPYAISNPRIVPVDDANRSASSPIRCSIETNKFGSG